MFNRKLHKLLKNTNNVEVIQANLTRDDYTRHGMRLRINGKKKVTRLIVNNIKGSMSRNDETPLILKWKEEKRTPIRTNLRTNHQIKAMRNPIPGQQD